MRFTAAILAFFMLLNTAQAGVVCPNPDFPNRCYVLDLKPGDKAPIAGDLFSVEYAIFLNQMIEKKDKELQLVVTATIASLKEDMKAQERKHKVDLELKDKEIELYKEKSKRNFMEQPAVIVTLTALVVTLLYIGTGATQRARNELVGN